MNVRDVMEALQVDLQVEGNLDAEVSGCYVSDLLSDVLANSKGGELWITHHTHPNVAAVSAVKELSAVIIVGGKPIEKETLERARSERVTVMTSSLSAFEAAGAIYTKIKASETV
jgi:predicted transcriptional regulator